MDDAIEKYKKAYEAYYGEPPQIEHVGSWLRIGRGPIWAAIKCRKSHLPSMTNQLLFRLSLRDCGKK